MEEGYKTRVFTEQEVAMLTTILKSQTATKVSIAIMDVFVTMRKYISKNLLDILSKTNKKIVYTKNIDKNLILKYQSQYNNLIIILIIVFMIGL